MADSAGVARILVVDDSAAARRVVCRCLPHHVLLEAADGEAALHLLATEPVDLVLLDIGLPGIDGYEVLRQLRATERGQDVMVILVTALGQTQEIVKGFEAHADDYIIKPFRQEELRARVACALRLKSLQDELRRINLDLEAEVRSRTAQLVAQQQFALLGRNSAQLAHNLNSPLTAMMGYVEIAMAVPADQQQLLAKARDVALEMQTIIGRLLGGVRSRTALADEAELLSLNDVVRQNTDFWQVDPQFRYRVAVDCELDDNLPRVKAVPSDLSQILTNLVDNALYALRGVENARLTLRTAAQHGYVSLAVTDNGCGIDPVHLERIFDPLFTTKPVGEGTGLGLASCYELAEAYGGRLEVASTTGDGTTFTLLLPPAAA